MDNLKVYQVNDCEWWATDTLENLRKAYNEQTGEEIDEEYLEECDLDNDGMYWTFEDTPEMAITIKILLKHIGNGKSNCKAEMDGKEYYFSRGEGYGMHVSFRRALELSGEFEKPFMIATTEY